MMNTDQQPESYYDIFKKYIVNEERTKEDIEVKDEYYELKDIFSNNGKKDEPYSLQVSLPDDCIVFQADRKGNNKLDFLRKDICLPDFIAFCEGKKHLYYFMIELKYPKSKENVPEKFYMGSHLINVLHASLLLKGKEKKIIPTKPCFIFGILVNNFQKIGGTLSNEHAQKDIEICDLEVSEHQKIQYEIFDQKKRKRLGLDQLVKRLETMNKPKLTHY